MNEKLKKDNKKRQKCISKKVRTHLLLSLHWSPLIENPCQQKKKTNKMQQLAKKNVPKTDMDLHAKNWTGPPQHQQDDHQSYDMLTTCGFAVQIRQCCN